MRRFFALSAVLLALVALISIPVFAAGPAPTADAEAFDGLTEEEPFTPAEDPEVDILDPGGSTFFEALRICDLDRDNPCDPGCLCVEIGGVKTCRC